MAGQLCFVNSGETALVANTAKTLLQIQAATNQRVVVKGLKILGKQAAGGTDAVVKVRMTRSTANFGSSSSATAGKANTSNGETLQTSCAKTFTVEPTSPTDSGLQWEIQPQSGVIEFIPPGMEVHVPGGNAVNFEATSTGTPTLLVTAIFEE